MGFRTILKKKLDQHVNHIRYEHRARCSGCIYMSKDNKRTDEVHNVANHGFVAHRYLAIHFLLRDDSLVRFLRVLSEE